MDDRARIAVTVDGRVCRGRAGETLLEVADRTGGTIDSQCRAGACGTCTVRVLRGMDQLSPRDGLEELVLSDHPAPAAHRLACIARVHGDVDVSTALGEP